MKRRRRIALRAGAAVCLVTAGLLWWPSSAGAQAESAPPEVGWWHRYSGGEGTPSESGAPGETDGPPQTTPPLPVPFPAVPLPEEPPAAPAPVPPPASVPDGGMYVSNDSLGAVAMGAVRFHPQENGGQVGESRLTLDFSSGGAGAGGLPIVACPLLEGFQAVSNGAWADRPAHDCQRALARGTIGADGTMSFVLSDAFQQAGQTTLDVVIMPEPNNGTPFSSTFKPVGSDALDSFGAVPDRQPAPSPPPFRPDPTAPAASFDAAPRPAGSVNRPQPAAPRPGSETAAPSAGGGAATPGSRSAQPVVDLDEPWELARPVAIALLVALGLALAAASTDRLRTAVPVLARLAGPAGDGAGSRGVGRFARSRTGLPPALS